VSGWFITATALAGAGLLIGLDIFTPSALIRGAALLRTVARYGERVVGHEAVLRRLAALRRDTFERIAALPWRPQRALRSGDWQSRLGADIDTLDALPLRVVWRTCSPTDACGSTRTRCTAGPRPRPGGWRPVTGRGSWPSRACSCSSPWPPSPCWGSP
jgi:hypothetical protein